MPIFLSSLLCLTAKLAFENQAKAYSSILLIYQRSQENQEILQNDSSTGHLMGLYQEHIFIHKVQFYLR